MSVNLPEVSFIHTMPVFEKYSYHIAEYEVIWIGEQETLIDVASFRIVTTDSWSHFPTSWQSFDDQIGRHNVQNVIWIIHKTDKNCCNNRSLKIHFPIEKHWPTAVTNFFHMLCTLDLSTISLCWCLASLVVCLFLPKVSHHHLSSVSHPASSNKRSQAPTQIGILEHSFWCKNLELVECLDQSC